MSIRNAIVANVVAANQLNVVAVVRGTDRTGSDAKRSSRLCFGPSAGIKSLSHHAKKHAAPATAPTAPGQLEMRLQVAYSMLAACQRGRLWRSQRQTPSLATLELALAG